MNPAELVKCLLRELVLRDEMGPEVGAVDPPLTRLEMGAEKLGRVRLAADEVTRPE